MNIIIIAGKRTGEGQDLVELVNRMTRFQIRMEKQANAISNNSMFRTSGQEKK